MKISVRCDDGPADEQRENKQQNSLAKHLDWHRELSELNSSEVLALRDFIFMVHTHLQRLCSMFFRESGGWTTPLGSKAARLGRNC